MELSAALPSGDVQIRPKERGLLHWLPLDMGARDISRTLSRRLAFCAAMLAALPLQASAAQLFAAVHILVLKKSCSWAREVVEPRWYFATVFALTLYYLILYIAVHRTREIIPVLTQYSPPKNLSPAALRYLFTGDSDRKTIAAVMLQLASRGVVSVECRKDWYFIRPRTNRLPPNLPPEEAAALSFMFLNDERLPTDRIPDFVRVRDLPGGVFPLHPLGGTNFLFLARKIHTALRAAHEKAYFSRNLMYSFPAISLSIFSVVYTAFPSPSAYFVAAFILAGILLTHFTPFVHEFLHHRFLQGGDDAGMIMLILVYVMLVVFLGSNVNQYYAAFQFSLLFAVFMNFAVPPMLRVPTEAGRQLLPEIDGYREFLSRVELDRLRRTEDPEWNPGAATENMAYAVALDRLALRLKLEHPVEENHRCRTRDGAFVVACALVSYDSGRGARGQLQSLVAG